MMGVAVMVREKYAVRLTPEERENLQRLVRDGKSPARMTTRARILLKTGDGWPAPQVAEALDVAKRTAPCNGPGSLCIRGGGEVALHDFDAAVRVMYGHLGDGP